MIPSHPAPKIDLHRHLDGNIRLSTILELAEIHGIELPSRDEDGLRPHVVVTTPQPGLLAFLEKFRWMVEVLVDAEACYRVARENMEDARREGLDYVELRFSPAFMAGRHGLDPVEVTDAVVAGISDGSRDCGVPAGIIGILSRTYGPETCRVELDALLGRREALCAIDLAGDEANFPPALFGDHFRAVRDAGLGVTIHAGEAAGSRGVWDAIRLLGATRIGHAVNAIEDPALLDFMLDRAIGIEANLTSNVQTSTVPDYAAHPLKRFLDAGLLATINTDDPGISGIDLRHEIEVAAPLAGLDEAMIARCAHNAAAIAFAAPDTIKIGARQSGVPADDPRP